MNMPRPRRTSNEEIADRLHSATIHLLRSLRQVDSESGLTAPRLSALSVLVFGGPRTLGQLASIEQVKPPTMSRLVNALEADGYVRREADPSDGRRTLINPTRKGEAVMRLGRNRRVASLTAKFEELTSKELGELEKAAALMSRLAAMPDKG
jgi:DNA-binding MarR family transcriptional regulator